MARFRPIDAASDTIALKRQKADEPFERWAKGYGVIRHSRTTQARIIALEARLDELAQRSDGISFFDLLHTLDRLACAALDWTGRAVERAEIALVAVSHRNRGRTYDTAGLLFVNGRSWAHCLLELARVTGTARAEWLDDLGIKALDGIVSPHGTIVPENV
jgi:hypothetical protein